MNKDDVVKFSTTIFKFESELGKDGYYTIIASCEQALSDDGEEWERDSRAVKVIDRDVVRGNSTAYIALLNIMQSEEFNLLDENKEQAGSNGKQDTTKRGIH